MDEAASGPLVIPGAPGAAETRSAPTRPDRVPPSSAFVTETGNCPGFSPGWCDPKIRKEGGRGQGVGLPSGRNGAQPRDRGAFWKPDTARKRVSRPVSGSCLRDLRPVPLEPPPRTVASRSPRSGAQRPHAGACPGPVPSLQLAWEQAPWGPRRAAGQHPQQQGWWPGSPALPPSLGAGHLRWESLGGGKPRCSPRLTLFTCR